MAACLRPRLWLAMKITQDPPDGLVLFVIPFLLPEGLFIRPFSRTLVRLAIVASCSFVGVWEDEPFPHFLEHVEEECLPILANHFNFAPIAEPRYTTYQRLISRDPGF